MKKVFLAMLLLVCVAAFGYSASDAPPPTHDDIEYVVMANTSPELPVQPVVFVACHQVAQHYSYTEIVIVDVFVQVPEVPLVYECYNQVLSSNNCNFDVSTPLKTLMRNSGLNSHYSIPDNLFAYSMASKN